MSSNAANGALLLRLAAVVGLFVSASLLTLECKTGPARVLRADHTTGLTSALASGGAGGAALSAPVKVEYRPSKLEALWLENVQQWQDQSVCRIMAEEQHEDIQRVLNIVLASEPEPAAIVSPLEHIAQLVDDADDDGLLSHMVYTYADGHTDTIRLEPLVGGLRDPRTLCQPPHGKAFTPALALPNEGFVSNNRAAEYKQWAIVDPRIKAMAAIGVPKALPPAMRGVQPAYRRALLFDAGGSRWMHAAGSRWLQFQFERIGVRFEHIYVWEAAQQPAADYFDGSSVDSRSRLHFFNVPVSTEPGHVDNPLTMLKAIATPEDLVVFKLDIDMPAMENALLAQVLEDPQLRGLVDEVAYEYHIDLPDFRWAWAKGRYPDDLAKSYSLFHRLRQAGIRAHPWP